MQSCFFCFFWFFGFLVSWFFGFLVFWFLPARPLVQPLTVPGNLCLAHLQWLSTHKPKKQKPKKTKKQKIKKPKNQKTKKTKNQKTKKNKKNKKTRPNTLHLTPSPWGVQSCFFLVFWFFGFLVFWFFGFLFFLFFGLCVDSPDLAHGSELFFCVLEVFGQTAKNHGKTMKTKSSDPCPLPGLSQTLPMGLNFFFVFTIVVLNVFHVKMLSSQYLSKKSASLQFAHLRPPGQTAKKNHGKTKIH